MENENVLVDTVDIVPPDGGAPVAPAADAPETVQTPLQVVSVDELVDRLTATGGEDNESPAADQTETEPEEEQEPTTQEQYYIMALEDTSGAETVQLLTEIRAILTEERPALTTPFEEYTVSETLLLFLGLSVFGSWLVRMLKGGFSWLLW